MQYDRKQALLDMIYQDEDFTRKGGLGVEIVSEALDLCLKTQDLDNFHKIILMRASENFIWDMLFLIEKYPLVLLQIIDDWSPGSKLMVKNKNHSGLPPGITGPGDGSKFFQAAINALAQAKDGEEKSLRLKVVMNVINYVKAVAGDFAYQEMRMRKWEEIAKKVKNVIDSSDFDDIVDSVKTPKPEKHWEPEQNQEKLDL